MDNIIELETIINYFEPGVFEQGKYYHDNHAVTDIKEENFQIHAKVKSLNNDKLYSVVIKFDDNKIVYTSCTCLFTVDCKHSAAALISFCKGNKHVSESPAELIDIIDETNIKEKIIKLNKSMIHNRFLDYRLEHIKPVETCMLKKENWKTIFILKLDTDYFNKTEEIDMRLGLGMQQVKDDGTPGRFMRYNNWKNPDPPDKNPFNIYDDLLMFENKERKLDYYLEFLIKKKQAVYYLDNHNVVGNQITFHELEFIDFSFNIEHILLNKKVTQFKLCAEFILKNGRRIKPKTFVIKNYKKYFLVFLPDSSQMFYFRQNVFLHNYLSVIFSCKIVTAKEITVLQDYVITNKLDSHLRIIFNKQYIKLIKVKPVTIIFIGEEEGKDLTSLYINYKYCGKNVNSEEFSSHVIIQQYDESNEILIAERNKKAEWEALQFLINIFKDHQVKDDKKEKTIYHFDLAIPIKDFFLMYGNELLDKGFELRLAKKTTEIQQGKSKCCYYISSGIDWFDCEVRYFNNSDNRGILNINRADVLRGLLYVNGKYVILTKEEVEALLKYIDLYGMTPNGCFRIHGKDYKIIEELYENIINKENEELKKTKEVIDRIKDFTQIEEIQVPLNFQGKLRDYQRSGLNWLYFLNKYKINGCLADDMGLGKTIQALVLMQKLKEEQRLGKVLLVVPVTTITNWENEINRFAPDLKYIRHIGSGRKKNRSVIDGNEIIITSYHTLRNDIEVFKDYNFNYLILDEAQNIKNYKTLAFKTVKLINASNKLSLTGTPIENNYSELWTQFDFLNHGLLGNIREFNEKYTYRIECDKDYTKFEELRRNIFPFILRRKKDDVAKELPEKEIIIHYCEMEKDQENYYSTIKEFFRGELLKNYEKFYDNNNAFKILKGIMRLRQAALFPSLADENYENLSSCKFEAMKFLLHEIIDGGHKALIFSQFVKLLNKIKPYINGLKIKYSYIDGAVKERDIEIKNFQENDEVKLFLISLKAGGVGINLTKADYVIIFDPWWNPAVENQAIDRSHRIGQTKKVIVYKLIVKNSIEEKMLILQNKKQNIFNNLIVEDMNFFKSLTREDIMFLFE